ncbi:hypothetical protein Nisw_04310 [Candidatus Nitrosopumilus sp. SW]|uniref:formyltransferase family protein n=1 Tax=Candidatus Nitrosopumilus sp. SW TaxID=2508726 RepID=UPI001150FF00|nr:formyltransferase family protein [Candidatus Nitrosopumilus sp. SW]QDI88799.1 hypothetical protein Nisw_04310 [Candidatus Nitrosopumilus sp. SW]
MKLGIILTPDERSKAYLQKILKNQIFIDEILFMNDDRIEPHFSSEIVTKSKELGFDISKSVKSTLKKHNLNFYEFNFVDINHPLLVEYLSKSNTDVFIFTGGGILREDILKSGPKFVHLHPGIVPNYRGSTCFYYSIINEDSAGVTAYFMDKNIDTGNIIFQKKFSKPDYPFIDEVYDAHIRSETLVKVLQNNLIQKGEIRKQNPDDGETFHIIHPVLKHIAILRCIKN